LSAGRSILAGGLSRPRAPRFLLPALMLLALGGCGTAQLADTSCGGTLRVAPAETLPSATGQAAPDVRTVIVGPRQVESRVAEAVAAEAATGAAGPVRLKVLMLSAGGQYGAFGAGFLRGWADRPGGRPGFDLITGVSAGAILAPAVHAGPRFGGALDVWNGLDQRDVYRLRIPSLLFGAPSIASVAPLERLVTRSITPDLLEALAARERAGDRLFVSAVNLDTSRAEIFDLGALAASSLSPEAKGACLREAVLASAAIPILMPPRQIEGAPYADGGLRDQVFLTSVENGRLAGGRSSGRPVEVEATLIVNGALDPPKGAVKRTLFGFGARSVLTLSDEVLRESVLDVVEFVEERPNWTLRAMVAPDMDLSACLDAGEGEGGQFDACITGALYAEGRRAATAPRIDWMTSRDLARRAGRYGAGDQ